MSLPGWVSTIYSLPYTHPSLRFTNNQFTDRWTLVHFSMHSFSKYLSRDRWHQIIFWKGKQELAKCENCLRELWGCLLGVSVGAPAGSDHGLRRGLGSGSGVKQSFCNLFGGMVCIPYYCWMWLAKHSGVCLPKFLPPLSSLKNCY